MIQTVTQNPGLVPLHLQPDFREKALQWACNHYDTCCYLTSNGYHSAQYSRLKGVLAVGVMEEIKVEQASLDNQPFAALQTAWEKSPGWWFGGLAYDLKNATEQLSSNHADGIQLPDLYFFKPLHLIHFSEKEIRIESQTCHADELIGQILTTELNEDSVLSPVKLQERFSHSEYLNTVEKIRDHIKAGDVYELNFCQEYFAEDYVLKNPLSLFLQLNQHSEAPFAGFFKLNDRYVCCASPERFLQKKGNRLISQPIKGTAPRHDDPQLDQEQKIALYNSEKDRAENVMIVDLVRNDLARSCQAGTVKVKELFGIYKFPQVFQMISTVTGVLRTEVTFSEAIKNAFPMGSMTGAPKVKSMELIEHYERSRRGWYSGAIGYITPDGDFDFNVVIRSLQYNASSRYLSFQVGGAIVFDSIPELEYEECWLKAKGILNTINSVSEVLNNR